MPFEPNGLATGIGSLPYTAVENAMPLIEKYIPYIPHWLQMPQRERQENFVEQFLEPLVKTGLLVDDGDKSCFDTTKPDWADNLTALYSIYLAYEESDLSEKLRCRKGCKLF